MAVVGTESRIVDTYKMRGLQTRLRVLRQLSIFIVAIVCFGAILMNIDAVQQIGSGLLASAGVAGIIAGFAAQKSLTTIIAGLQVAHSRPMKIGGSHLYLRRQLDLFSLDSHCVVVRANPGAMGLGIHLGEFRAKEENLRGIKNPQ
jgi:hypothetical protein